MRDIDVSLPDFVNINKLSGEPPPSPSPLNNSSSGASPFSPNNSNGLSNNSNTMNNNTSSTNYSNNNNQNNNNNHINYYYLNDKGKQAVKRILCVYEYNFPQVTFNPGLVSISSILLHFMQEHEVFAALCYMSSTKEHLIESRSSWETTCSVFTRLVKTYAVHLL